MSRLAGRYASRSTSAEGRHSRTTDRAPQPERGRTAGPRGRYENTGNNPASGWNSERHDWLVPLELP